jgi:hypothetical protein
MIIATATVTAAKNSVHEMNCQLSAGPGSTGWPLAKTFWRESYRHFIEPYVHVLAFQTCHYANHNVWTVSVYYTFISHTCKRTDDTRRSKAHEQNSRPR